MTTNIQTFAGNVGIGTNDPGSFKLNVNGSVSATSLTVGGITNSEVPVGAILLWYGTVATIPTGWTFCNGVAVAKTDGSGNITPPNLRDKFILGATADSPTAPYPGQTGGGHEKEIATAQLPPHAHPIASDGGHAHNTNQAGGHDHRLSGSYGKRIVHRGPGIQNNTGRAGNGNGVIVNDAYNTPGWNLHGNQSTAQYVGNHSHNTNTASGHTHGGTTSIGSGNNFDVRPSYYVLAYIMKI